MNEIKIGSITKLFIVLLLSERKQHGYEIIKSVEIRLEKNLVGDRFILF